MRTISRTRAGSAPVNRARTVGFRAEGNDVARRQGPVVLRHGRVLVDGAATIEERVPHDRALLDADREHDAADRVRQLLGEAVEQLRLPVEELVVHRDPAVARPGDRRAGRAAEPRQRLLHRALDGADVVRLHVHRSERRAGETRETLLERRDLRTEIELHGREPPALVDRPRLLVRRKHVELEHLDALRFESRDQFADELGGDTAAPCTRTHVKTGEIADARAGFLGDRETYRFVVALREQDMPPLAEAALDLREILFGVVVAMRRVLELVHELAKELPDDRQVCVGGFADHGMRCESKR